MTNFTAKECGELDGLTLATGRPGDKVPAADGDHLCELGATEYFPRKWQYLHPKHTLRDVLRPGYFAGDERARLNVGDEIFYTMCGGSKLPSEWARGIIVVETKSTIREAPLGIAIIHRYPKPTPVAHDGEASERAA